MLIQQVYIVLTFNQGCGAGAKVLFCQVGARPTAPAPNLNDANKIFQNLLTDQNVYRYFLLAGAVTP